MEIPAELEGSTKQIILHIDTMYIHELCFLTTIDEPICFCVGKYDLIYIYLLSKLIRKWFFR